MILKLVFIEKRQLLSLILDEILIISFSKSFIEVFLLWRLSFNKFLLFQWDIKQTKSETLSFWLIYYLVNIWRNFRWIFHINLCLKNEMKIKRIHGILSKTNGIKIKGVKILGVPMIKVLSNGRPLIRNYLKKVLISICKDNSKIILSIILIPKLSNKSMQEEYLSPQLEHKWIQKNEKEWKFQFYFKINQC